MELQPNDAIRHMRRKHSFYAGAIGAMLSLFGCFAVVACSDDEEQVQTGEDQEETLNSTLSIEVNAGSMPVAGTLTVEFSDYVNGLSPANLVDGNTQSTYTTPHQAFYIHFEGEEACVIDHYSLTSSSGVSERDPYSWILYASNDNVTWEELDRQERYTFSERRQTAEFEFANETAYRYYQLEIVDNWNGAQTSINEWTLSKGPANPDIPYAVSIQQNTNMRSQTGVITSQYCDSPLGKKVDMLLDGDASTVFATGFTRFYLTWEQYEETYGNFYTLTASADDASTAPRAWKFYSSPDGIQWELQDEQTDQEFAPGETKQFFCKENTNYDSYENQRFYKLEVEANNGGTDTQLAEWGMGYECRNVGDIMFAVGNFFYSPLTPMGRDYDGLINLTTPEILEQLADPNVEPDETDYGEGFYWNEDIDVNLYPFGEPLPTDVNQHQIGNCSVLATYASLVYMYPEYVKHIIHENADGTYTVDMFTPKGEPVAVVLKPTLLHTEEWREHPTYKYGVSSKNDVTAWSCFIEKAMMKWESVYDPYENHCGANLGGMNASLTNPLFTGRGEGFSIAPGVLSPQELQVAVNDALKKGMIVTGGFSIDNQTSEGWTTTGHTWSVTVASNPDALFAMRNPWGTCDGGDGAMDGILNVYDDGVVPQTVGLDFWHPGAARDYYESVGLPVGRTTLYDIPAW